MITVHELEGGGISVVVEDEGGGYEWWHAALFPTPGASRSVGSWEIMFDGLEAGLPRNRTEYRSELASSYPDAIRELLAHVRATPAERIAVIAGALCFEAAATAHEAAEASRIVYVD